MALTKPAAVSETELSEFKLFAEYSAAAYCNGEDPAGAAVTCENDTCTEVEAHNATVISSFS